MHKKLIGEWKKAFENDLPYIVQEMKSLLDTPAAIIMEGALGSGKTRFCKSFTDDDLTVSPSYSVVTESGDVLHADLYRLESREDIIHLEIPLYLENKNFAFFEWGEKFLTQIMRELPEGFQFYLLDIEVNKLAPEAKKSDTPSRNFSLRKIKEDM